MTRDQNTSPETKFLKVIRKKCSEKELLQYFSKAHRKRFVIHSIVLRDGIA